MIFIFNTCAPQSVSRPEIFFAEIAGESGNSRSRPFPGLKVSDFRRRIMGVDFFILCPFLNFLNAIFSFPSRFWILGMVTNTQTPGHLGHPRASLLLTSEKTVFCNYIRDVYFSRPERCFTYADIFVTDPLIKTHYVQIGHLSPSQSCQSSRNLKPLLADRTARTQASSQFYQLDSFRQQ